MNNENVCPPSNFIFPMFVIFSYPDQMSVFGTSLARKEVFVHIMINMWYQFSGADLFFGKRRIFVFIFSRLMEWGQQQLICVCILMIDNCSQSLRASSQQSRFICPKPVHSCPEAKPKLSELYIVLVNEIL